MAYRALMLLFSSITFMSAFIFLVRFRPPASLHSIYASLKRGVTLTEEQIVSLGVRMLVSAVAVESLRVIWIYGRGNIGENKWFSLALFSYFAASMSVYLVGYLKVRSRHLEGVKND